MTPNGAHLSIGEVLAVLREEFPDVTVSKIRFLESQGLVAPERTPSGYRKFREPDVEQLRWVLRQQKEHFLPLKIIRGRLDTEDPPEAGEPRDPVDPPVLFRTATPPAAEPAALTRRHEPPAREAVVVGAPKGESRTRAELAAAAGIDDDTVAGLERYGLLPPPRRLGDEDFFDEDALEVARLAGRFKEHGVDPRHLRMYRTMGDREAALFAQVAMPFLKQRSPQARHVAQEMVADLAALGRDLRVAMLRLALREPFDE